MNSGSHDRRPHSESSPEAGSADQAGGTSKSGADTPHSTRDKILHAARELFHQNGYTATGISAILKKAGVNSGSLYHYFPTKEDLLLALLEKYKDMLWPAVMEPAFSRIDDPIERVFGVLDGYRCMLLITGCSLGCPIGNLALELSDTHPAARKELAANFDGWKRHVEKCLDDAADRLPDDVDRKELASFVLTIMEGAMMQAKTYRSLAPFDAAIMQLRDYFDRLLADGTDWSAPRRQATRHRYLESESTEAEG